MNEIERKIKQEANNSSFEFKEEYWDATLVKLKQAEKALLFKRIGWIFFSVIAIGSITYFGFLNTNSSVNENSIAKIESQNNNSSSNKTKLDNSNSFNKNKENTLNTSDLSKNNNSLENNSNTKNKRTEQDNNSLAANLKDNKKSNDNLNSNNDLNVKNNSFSLNKGKSNRNRSNVTRNLASNFNNANSINSKPLVKRNFTVDHYQQIPNKNKTNTKNPINRNNEKSFLTIEQVPLLEYEMYGNVGNKKLTPVLMPALSVSNPNNFVLQAFVGTNISTSFVKENITFDIPYGGIEFGYLLSNQLLISSGIGWYKKSGLDYSLISESETVYDFGLERNSKSIEIDESYWLEFPIKISYPIFNQKHRIGLGFAYSHLLGAKSKYVTTHERTIYNTDNPLNPTSEKRINGSTELLFPSSYSLLGSYQFQYNRFGTEIKFHYGLNDIIKNEFVTLEKTERNNRVTITLKYSIF